MKADDANLARDKISVYVPKQDSFQTVKTRLEELQQIVDKGWSHADQTFDHHAFRAIHFNRHLYYPLIHLPHDQHLTSSPVGLNQGEWTFVRNLERYYREQADGFSGSELFLLRNESRGRGFGFFLESGFFPDFILWLIKNDMQYVVFIDPKGIQYLGGMGHPKLSFYSEIKNIEKKLDDQKISLEAFILSVPSFEDISWNNNMEEAFQRSEFEKRHVLFQQESELYYIKKMCEKIYKDVKHVSRKRKEVLQPWKLPNS
jgi:hypothetical protein